MAPRSCVNVGDDKSDGGRCQREAQQVGEQLPFQKEHPGKAGEAYAREGAEEQRIPPRGEKRVHEDERAQGVGDAAQHGVQGVTIGMSIPVAEATRATSRCHAAG